VLATDSDNVGAGTLSAHFVIICLISKQIVRTQEHNKFLGLFRTKLIFQDSPGPGKFTKKTRPGSKSPLP